LFRTEHIFMRGLDFQGPSGYLPGTETIHAYTVE
jgi:hypothetical protein